MKIEFIQFVIIMYSLDDSVWNVRERDYNYHICELCSIYGYYPDHDCIYNKPVLQYKIFGCGHFSKYCFDSDDEDDTTPSKISLYEDIKIRRYIVQGEQCSICLEPILHRNKSWLTPCGHAFHRKCICDAYLYGRDARYTNMIPCPLCREELTDCCVGIEYNNRYKGKNILDILENFWLTLETRSIEYCSPCRKPKGFTQNCERCIRWRGYSWE